MAAIPWCDRKNHKVNIKEWLTKDEKFSAIGIFNSQELRDIANWIKDNFQDCYSIGMAHYDSDVDIKKHILLDDLTIRLGGDKTFKNFHNYLTVIETKYNKLLIKQEIGNQASAKGSINFEGVTSIVNVSLNELTPSDVIKDRQINKLFTEFINDIKNLNGNHPFLFLIRFGNKGFNVLSPDFKHWFLQSFCQKMALLENITICILNQGNIDEFKDYNPDYDVNIPEYLEFNDIVDETKTHMEKLNPNYVDWCQGVIDPGDNRVKYNEFKRKLLAYIKKSAVSGE